MSNTECPRCPQCRSTSLTLMEEHLGVGGWSSDEWSLNENGHVVYAPLSGWSRSEPTGRWLYECEDCGHQWTKRTPTEVANA